MSSQPPRPTPAAAVVALTDNAVLLVRRGRPPNEGLWSFPGGSVEPGETVREAAVRECREETGIAVPLDDAEPRPGDDAAEARWVPLTDLDRYALTPAMRAVLARALERLPTLRPKVQRPRPKAQRLSTATVGSLGEFALIERLAEIIASLPAGNEGGEVLLAVGDDAAVLAPNPGSRLVATVDTLMEGIHFRRDWTSAADLGWKSLAVNVSDAGAMGAQPWVALVSLALPPDVPVSWVEELYGGLTRCARRYGCTVAGGDTVGSRHDIGITVALLGVAAPAEIRQRDGARPGDLVAVTGTLGDSGAGLALLEAGLQPASAPEWEPLFRAHLRPEPPLAAARALAAVPAVTAMMDLSDGLASDLRHICTRSGAGARVRAAALPMSEAMRAAAAALGRDPLDWALRGGEEYQLLFTLAPEAASELPDILRDTGVTATVVGEMTASGYVILHADGHEESLSPQAFDHFGTAESTDTA